MAGQDTERAMPTESVAIARDEKAAGQLSAEAKAELSAMPWPKIIGMRNRLVHAYFDINLDILWRTIIEGLPPIMAELERVIPRND